MRQECWSPGVPHREYWRTVSSSSRSMCAPGVQAGSWAPAGSARVRATTPSARVSRAVMSRSLRRSEKTVSIASLGGILLPGYGTMTARPSSWPFSISS